MVSTLVQSEQLTAADRCDRCGAQAAARVTLASGLELLFCGHHLRAHSERLKEIGTHIRTDAPPLTGN